MPISDLFYLVSIQNTTQANARPIPPAHAIEAMTTASRPHDALRAAYLRESRRGEVHCGRGLYTMAGACVGDARCALLTLAGAPGSTPESGGRGTQMEGAGGTRYARRRDWINAVREGVDRSRCILPWVGHGRPPASSCGWAGGHGQSRLIFLRVATGGHRLHFVV